MNEAHIESLCDEVFGATRHDPALWREHPMVAKADGDFESEYGWVKLWLREAVEPRLAAVKASYVAPDATRERPDLYFWGERDCPIPVFERIPRLRELRVSIEGPIEGDPRTCWSVGVWLGNVR